MRPGVKPEIVISYSPVPVPLVTLLSPVVGLADVPQQIPLSETEAPPSAVTLPPVTAEDVVRLDTAVVVTVGAMAEVVNVACSPYAVPALLVAYALI